MEIAIMTRFHPITHEYKYAILAKFNGLLDKSLSFTQGCTLKLQGCTLSILSLSIYIYQCYLRMYSQALQGCTHLCLGAKFGIMPAIAYRKDVNHDRRTGYTTTTD